MSLSLTTISSAYSSLLTPIPPFTWFDSPVSTLDVLATIRLCIIMRQIREMYGKPGERTKSTNSFLKNAFATLTVVYGGEAITGPWLGQPPSFLLSPTFPLLYIVTQYVTEVIPTIPGMSLETEGPLTFLDALTRSYLLTTLLPPNVLTHTDSRISTSPYTLLLSTFITANGGFFIVNLFSMFNPSGWTLATPAELGPYGWTTVDLWAAPLVTALLALLTNAQPFWATLHLAIAQFADGTVGTVKPWTTEEARSLGAVVLWVLFAGRTARNFGRAFWKKQKIDDEKKTQ